MFLLYALGQCANYTAASGGLKTHPLLQARMSISTYHIQPPHTHQILIKSKSKPKHASLTTRIQVRINMCKVTSEIL